MYSFTVNDTKARMEKACGLYSNITKTAGESGTIWEMYANFWNNRHKVTVIQTADGAYRYSTDNGNFECTIEGDKISLTAGEYFGRKCRSERTLKKFEATSMLLFSLVKCGKLR